jgi:cytochrome c553
MSNNGSKMPGRPQKYVDGVLMDCSDADIAQIAAERAANAPAEPPPPPPEPKEKSRAKR